MVSVKKRSGGIEVWWVLCTGPTIREFNFNKIHDNDNTIGANGIGLIYNPDLYWISDPYSIQKFGDYVNGSLWITERFSLCRKDRTDRRAKDWPDIDSIRFVGKAPHDVVEYHETFRKEKFSTEKFRNANQSGFSCLTYICQNFDPDVIKIVGMDGYEINNEHFYKDRHHGENSEHDYWNKDYVQKKNERNITFLKSFAKWCYNNDVELSFETPSMYEGVQNISSEE